MKYVKRGVNAWSKCSPEYVVQYFDSWIENNNIFIQMELCSDNLMNIIKQKQSLFRRPKSEAMNSIEYFISCEIFKEILECVQYLHENNIMHRDLNPKNILVNKFPKNNRFLKLCDFDLAKEGDYNSVTNTGNQGTFKYMAPEVTRGEKYSAKCDIFSLGEVGYELFDFNVFG